MKVGDVVQGKYELEREIGQGSFGTVYMARQKNIDRIIALKVLLPWVKADEAMRHRFKREAKLASVLKNEHTIDIHDFGESDEGDLYIIMEYLEGAPLDQILAEEGKMTPQRVNHIARQVLKSLAEAHTKGIVHRDLKPDNIFLCNNETQRDFVKVFDFGIAKIIGGGQGALKETTKLTVTGGTVGTPVYMSPEQCRGQELTPASDLYSLGVVMYEALKGEPPFEDSNPVQTMMMHNSQPVPPLPEDIAGTAVAKAVMRALQKKSEDRFSTAEEFLAFLDGTDETFAVPQEPSSEVVPASSSAPTEVSTAPTVVNEPSPVPPAEPQAETSPPVETPIPDHSPTPGAPAAPAGVPNWALFAGAIVIGLLVAVGAFVILTQMQNQ